MSDLTNEGAAAPADDDALFSSTISGNEGLPSDPPEPPAPLAEPPAPVAATPAPEPAIPPSRLREEADARRAAERRAEALERELTAFRRQPAQVQQPKADPVDRVLSTPSEFIREEAAQVIAPHLQTMHFNNRLIAESVRGGKSTVDAAVAEYDQLENSGHLSQTEIHEVRTSPNPFVAAVDLIARRKTLTEVGTDLDAYRKRIREEAMKDPEFQKQVLAATRQVAQQNGNVVARPAFSAPPSLNRIGAAALPDNQADVDDSELFSMTTHGKRSAPR